MRRIGDFRQNEFGHLALPSTRPGLVGAMTADSPVGLAARLLDKFTAWTPPVEKSAREIVADDSLLTNLSRSRFALSGRSAARRLRTAAGLARGADDVGDFLRPLR